jgi:hypothetical protein
MSSDVAMLTILLTLSMIFARLATFNRGRSQSESPGQVEKKKKGGEARRGILRIQGERKEERAMGKSSRTS